MTRLSLVPAKPLARAKARLGVALPSGDRRRLVLAMLRDVVAAAAPVALVWVVCSDEEARLVARDGGAEPIPDETPDAGLNSSLEAATARAIAAGFDEVLVLASDLPCVAAADVAAMFAEPGVAIAPNRAGTGTNALLRSPPNAIAPAFGDRSREAHERLAREAGFGCRIVVRPGLTLDVDRPEDLALASKIGPGQATAAAVASCADAL